jgi:hypothetical protein
MFWPPLAHDVLAAGFAGRAEGFAAGAAVERAALLAALADIGHTAADRVNGHPQPDPAALTAGLSSGGTRQWLVDEARGLALGLSRWSNTGVGTFAEAPRDPRSSPWTDLYARLVSLGEGGALASEQLVVRVPYGQGSGWDG